MFIDRYIDSARELAQEEALKGLEEYFRMMDAERDTEADITAMHQEHMLERIGAV